MAIQISLCEWAIFWGKDMPADLPPLMAAYALVCQQHCGGIIAYRGPVDSSPMGDNATTARGDGLANMTQMSVCGRIAAMRPSVKVIIIITTTTTTTTVPRPFVQDYLGELEP